MEYENYLFTVGHSNVDMENFLELIRSHGVELIVDVRSSPYSKYVPQFNRENLKANLEDEAVEYRFLGDRIGGKPRDEKYYEDGRVVYSLIEAEPSYKEGISGLMELLKTRKTSLMCSEENPFNCHRHNLIGQTLLRRGVKVIHIRGNGKLEKARMNDVQTILI